MLVPNVTQRYAGAVRAVAIGATAAQSGTRSRTVTIGGQTGLPLLGFEATYPNRPAFALEVSTAGAGEWHEEVRARLAGVSGDIAAWAARCEGWGADLVCLDLAAAHPDRGGRDLSECAGDVRRVLAATGLPLVLWGTDADEVDTELLPACAEAAAGENCLIGPAKQKTYRTVAAACLADGHKVLAETPSDINLAKQLNILLRDAGVPLDGIVVHPTTGALGFGMEYIYTSIERARLAGLAGDVFLQQPIVVNVGREVGRVKEAVEPDAAAPAWGARAVRAPLWEAATALCYVEAGADLIVLRDPQALAWVRQALDAIWPDAPG